MRSMLSTSLSTSHIRTSSCAFGFSPLFAKKFHPSFRAHQEKPKIFPLVLAMTLNAGSKQKAPPTTEQKAGVAKDFEVSYNQVMAAWPGEMDATWEGCVKGKVPQELIRGTFWINGPGSPHHEEGRLTHPFDSHGYVRALRILDDGKCRLQAKMIKTPLFLKEQKAGKMLSTGLATLPHSNWLRNLFAPMGRNAGNTCVLPWAGKILTLYEGGLPHALNPDTLETLGTETFGGALSSSDMFLAHTRWDAKTNRLLGMTPRHSGHMGTEFVLREIDEDGRQHSTTKAKVDCFTYAHDLAITPNHWVIMDCSVDVSMPSFFRALTRTAPLIESVQFVQRLARLVLVPRKGGESRTVKLDRPMLAIHHANAWEEEDGTVVLISCILPGFAFGKEFGWQGPWRPFNPAPEGWPPQVMRIEVSKDGQATTRLVSDLPVDFPKVRPERDGLPTKHMWGTLTRDKNRRTPLCGLAHIDIEAAASDSKAGAGEDMWLAPPGCMVGEPLVVPKIASERDAADAREEDVWVVCMLYDGSHKRSTVAVFDGSNVQAGPVCEIELPLLLPYGFHGFWQSAPAPPVSPPPSLRKQETTTKTGGKLGQLVAASVTAGTAAATVAAAAATASAVALVALMQF